MSFNYSLKYDISVLASHRQRISFVIFHKIAWASAVTTKRKTVSLSECEIHFGLGLLTPLAYSQYFSPCFLQPHKILPCQPPSALFSLSTSGCSYWIWSSALGCAKQELLPSTFRPLPPDQVCAMKQLLSKLLISCGYLTISPLSTPLPFGSPALKWPSHSC